MSTIYDEIDQLWNASSTTTYRPDDRWQFLDLILEQAKHSRTETTPALQPWLGIFEFGIEWLSRVYAVLHESLPDHKDQCEYRAAWALIGAAVSFGLSIRLLCVSGFDTPARALLRSYVETLLLCLAVLDDKVMAQHFVSLENDVGIKNFWHSMASPKNLHARILDIEKRSGLTPDQIAEFEGWRRHEFEMLSQASHLSFPAAVCTVATIPLGEKEQTRTAIWGLASEGSRRTIDYAAATTWYFSAFSYRYLFGLDAKHALLTSDQSDEGQLRIELGREILAAVVLAHWSEDD
jgi:hypothetical protein